MPQNESKFAVLTADIVGSRKLRNRGLNRERLLEALEELNLADETVITSKFCLFRGDEIQGVVFPPAEWVPVVRHLRFYLRPAQVRVGIGIGDITTSLDRDNPWNMDGSAFHRAREALEGIQSYRQPRTAFSSAKKDFDRNLNVILALMDAISSRWTEPQWEAIHSYEKMGTYLKAAQVLKVRMQNVAKRCRAARWGVFLQAENHIQELIISNFGSGS